MTGSTPPTDHVATAIADLANRLGLRPEQITVVSDEAVTWPDAALGCPQPGRVYAQTLVEGRRIVLEAAGRTYAYHWGGSATPFLCADPQPPAP